MPGGSQIPLPRHEIYLMCYNPHIGPPGIGMKSSANRLATVNGLRGLAIIAVMYFHQSDWRAIGPFIPGTDISLAPLLHNTWTGVNLFFVLSGFVLFLPYVNGRRSLATLADALNFWQRRFFRLMPAYYVAAVVLIAVTYAVWNPDWLGPDALRVLTLGFVFARYHFTPQADGAFWSLGVEVLFSLIFPLLIVLRAGSGCGGCSAWSWCSARPRASPGGCGTRITSPRRTRFPTTSSAGSTSSSSAWRSRSFTSPRKSASGRGSCCGPVCS
jgi:peptidoglycan/LPS O-acetylase OafA/YrhL